MTVGTALSSAKCTSRRRGAPGEACAAARGPRSLAAAPVVVAGRAVTPPGERSRGSAAALFVQICCKGPIGPGRARRIVDIPRFCSRSIRSQSAFATDLDNRPPRTVPGAPPAPARSRLTRTASQEAAPPMRILARPRPTRAIGDDGPPGRSSTAPRAGGLTRRARVCYTLCPLLRSFTLRCTRRRSAAEGEEAQQTERGAADGAERPPRSRGSHFFAAQPLPRRRRTSSRIIRTASSGPTALVSMTRRSRPHGS